MINIAIDGPAGAGKSTVAKAVAKELGILYLDTGAMYRACALKAERLGVPCDDEAGVSGFIDKIDLALRYEEGAQRVYLDGGDVSEEIRAHRMSKMASDISRLKCVRLAMVALQRQIAKEKDVVLDGRDIGTFVLPGAQYKFYLTADSAERARRRCAELAAKGIPEDYERLLADIEARDRADMSRDFAPLRRAPDAVLLDSTEMTIEEVTREILSRIGR